MGGQEALPGISTLIRLRDGCQGFLCCTSVGVPKAKWSAADVVRSLRTPTNEFHGRENPYPTRRSFRDVKRVRLGAVVAVALAVGFGAWLLVRDGDGDSSTERAEPVATTLADLRALDEQSGHPVYRVGPRPGTKYEVTRTSNGNVYIRYLTEGAPVGDERPNYLTVARIPSSKRTPASGSRHANRAPSQEGCRTAASMW